MTSKRLAEAKKQWVAELNRPIDPDKFLTDVKEGIEDWGDKVVYIDGGGALFPEVGWAVAAIVDADVEPDDLDDPSDRNVELVIRGVTHDDGRNALGRAQGYYEEVGIWLSYAQAQLLAATLLDALPEIAKENE